MDRIPGAGDHEARKRKRHEPTPVPPAAARDDRDHETGDEDDRRLLCQKCQTAHKTGDERDLEAFNRPDASIAHIVIATIAA